MLRGYVLVVVMMVLSLLVVVSCGRSQPVSLPDTSEAGTTSHETELPVIGEAPDFELTNQDEGGEEEVKLSHYPDGSPGTDDRYVYRHLILTTISDFSIA